MKNEFFSRLHQTLVHLLLFVYLVVLSDGNNLNCLKTTTRPFYVIGHMCNSLTEVKEFVTSGANSVEIDIQFTEDGLPEEVYHGPPCDCWRRCQRREEIDTMFEYLKQISTPGDSEYQPHFTLVLLDLKIRRLSEKAKMTAGMLIADKLINIVFESEQGSSKLKVVIGLEIVQDYEFVFALVDRFNQRNFPALLDRIGFDVSATEDVEKIEYLWRFVFENKLNVWQGDGITNCLSLLKSGLRLQKLIKMRNSNSTQGYTAKVYGWTVDNKWQIRDKLRLGIDGMITNEVRRLTEILDSDEFKPYYHVATNDDDPFCLVRESELEAVRHNYHQLSKHKLINNLMITNYVMQDNEQSSTLTTSQPKPFLNTNNNFETDNLIRTGNDFKRISFSDFNFRQLLSQFLSFFTRRNTYDNIMKFNLLAREAEQFGPSEENNLNTRAFQRQAGLF